MVSQLSRDSAETFRFYRRGIVPYRFPFKSSQMRKKKKKKKAVSNRLRKRHGKSNICTKTIIFVEIILATKIILPPILWFEKMK